VEICVGNGGSLGISWNWGVEKGGCDEADAFLLIFEEHRI